MTQSSFQSFTKAQNRMPPGKTMDGWCTALRSGLAWLRATLPRESRIRFNNEFMPLLHHTKQETLGQNDSNSWYLVYIGIREGSRKRGYAKKLIEWGTKQVSDWKARSP